MDEDDIAAVVKVLRGKWLTQGPTVSRFESAVADYVGARHAVAFSSGTAALHGAVFASGLGPGNLVVTSPLTFMASANCARYVGASVGLVDIDRATLNLDVSAIPREADGVVAVHYAGLPARLDAMRHRPRVVIEDAAHALGARTPDGPVGNCARSDLCVFSFHPVKPITTGEGGMVTTNDDAWATRLRRFRSHDITPRPDGGGWCYEIHGLGYNYRLADLQAGLGLSQLAKLDAFIVRRNEVADRYRSLLAGLPITLPPTAPYAYRHGYHLFPVLVSNRRKVFETMRHAGIGVQVHYVPVHHHPISADLGYRPGDFPACDEVYEQILSLPMFPTLSDMEQNRVVAVLSEAVK